MEYRAFALLGLAAVLLPAGASDRWERQRALTSFEGPVSAHVERVVDGDTIEVKADIWLQQSLTVRVRIDGVDAPELEARCADERARAEVARDFLERRIGNANVQLTHMAYDKYGGRVDASVADAHGDITESLLRSDFARPYHGGKHQPWCEAA
jgi:micrococcal nuclease